MKYPTEARRIGMEIVCDWAGGDAARMRLVSYCEHPAGNVWFVNVYRPHARRFSKVLQAVDAAAVDAAIAKAKGGAA